MTDRSNTALKQLLEITNNSPLVKNWINKWILCVSDRQLVINNKYVNSEFEDTIKIQLVRNTAEELTEVAANFKIEKNKYEVEMLVLKRNTGGNSN